MELCCRGEACCVSIRTTLHILHSSSYRGLCSWHERNLVCRIPPVLITIGLNFFCRIGLKSVQLLWLPRQQDA